MLASAERGQPEAIQQCIEDAQSGALNLKRQLMVLAEHRPAAFEARVRALLAPEQVAPKVLEEIYLMAKQNVALADEVWPRYAASFPDRRRLHEVRMFYLFRERDLAAVAKLGREVHLQRGWADSTGVMISVAFVQERDWGALRRVSQEWVALGEEREQASFFLGLACARLGALEEAAGQLDRATSLRRVGKTWFSSALLELAHLRARPDAPERLRDPPRALALLARFDEEKTRGNRPGPWTSLVRATVHEANGELERAREHVAQGLRARRRENQAPVDVQEQLQALAARLR
jgi:tetratricopeptide (TPR) repeat protein